MNKEDCAGYETCRRYFEETYEGEDLCCEDCDHYMPTDCFEDYNGQKPFFMKVKRLRQIEKRILEIWGKQELEPLSPKYLIWLLRKQLEEIEQNKFSDDAVERELSDVIIICLKWLRQIKRDAKVSILHRLETRHRGRTEEIAKKYEGIWNEENQA